MEVSSLFEDLAYSIEIAGHDAGLQHYGARMLLDTASLDREYREWYVPEEWHQPYFARAELSFHLDALREARAQFTPEEAAEAFGLIVPDELESMPPALMVDLVIRFTLDLQNWGMEQVDSERWHTYLGSISAREKLEAGLRNLRGELREALRARAEDKDWDPHLEPHAETYLSSGFGLLPRTLQVEWVAPINADLEEEDFNQELQAVMLLVRAGIEAARAFQEEIRRDYETVS